MPLIDLCMECAVAAEFCETKSTQLTVTEIETAV